MDFCELAQNDFVQNILRYLIRRLLNLGFEKMWRIPTFKAQAHYKKALVYEDLYYRYFNSTASMMFKESSNPENFFGSVIDARKNAFFTAFLTSGVLLWEDWLFYLDRHCFETLDGAGLAISGGKVVKLKFRLIPTPHGVLITDVFSQTRKDGVHLGIDSILFWNYLKIRKDFIERCNHALDLGCGSGIHAMLLANLNPRLDIHCTDINGRALACAQVNFLLNKNLFSAHVRFHRSNWFASVPREPSGYDLILCNPPFEYRSEGDEESCTISAFGGGAYGTEETLRCWRKYHGFFLQRAWVSY